MHPLVLSITGVVEPSTGLQSKFSTLHSAAVALIDGAAGTAQYSDARANDPVVAALRRKVKPVADETLRRDEAHAAIVAGGERHEVHVAHASGTADNPMSDAAIEAKFLANATPVIGAERADSAPRMGRGAGQAAGRARADRAAGVAAKLIVPVDSGRRATSVPVIHPLEKGRYGERSEPGEGSIARSSIPIPTLPFSKRSGSAQHLWRLLRPECHRRRR